MTKEPSKDFRQVMMEILNSKVIVPTSAPKKIGNVMIPDGEFVNISADEATTRILALCKEMLVPEEAIDSDDGNQAMMSAWNACRTEMLKRLGGKS